MTKEQAEEAALWFEKGVTLESAADAEVMWRRAALALRAFGLMLEGLEGACKIINNPSAPIAYISHYGPKINNALIIAATDP